MKKGIYIGALYILYTLLVLSINDLIMNRYILISFWKIGLMLSSDFTRLLLNFVVIGAYFMFTSYILTYKIKITVEMRWER